MALHFELAGSQIDGARDYQEDAFLITHMTDANDQPSALVIVADGMGGHAAGNVASNMAVQAFNKHISSNYPSDDIPDILSQAIAKANNSVKETVSETPALQGMGCTMVAAILQDGKMWWASVGDSHLYLIRNKELIKKNANHSYGGFLDRMKAEGTPVNPEPGLSRNMLMSAITGEDINEVDVSETPLELEAGDKILICSDGLDTLSAGKIIQFSDWSESPKECADALMNAVKEADMPRQDNTTAVVVNVVDLAQVAKAPEPPPVKEEIGERTDEIPVVGPEVPIGEPPSPAPDTAEPESKKGLVIGIAAVIVIGIAIAGFMLMGDKKAGTKPVPDVTVAETEAVVEDEETAKEEEPVKEEAPAVAPVTAEEKKSEAVAVAEPETPKPAEQTAPAEAAPAEPAKSIGGNKIQDTLKAGGKAPLMIIIPDGTFEMGSPGSSRYAEERPRHTVKIKKFAVSQYEITFAEYNAFATATGRRIPDNLYLELETYPVIYVSWDDAYYYTKWLTEQTGQKYRLPSEAEWEYMASGGKKSNFWWGFNEEPKRAHCFGCGAGLDPRKPAKIGLFEPNQFNVYDTAGNVAEWVHDCWHDNYDGAPTSGEVWEGGDCAYRVVRGGSYSSPPQSLRHAKRDKFKSDSTYDHIGIRVVRDID